MLNLIMIGGGMTAIVVFEDFARTLLYGLETDTIRTQTAHIQVASNVFWKHTGNVPKDSLLPQATQIQQNIKNLPHVQSAVGRLAFFGLLSKGEQSYSIRGLTIDVSAERGLYKSYKFIAGRVPQKTNSYQIALGSGLANRLHAKVNDRVTLLSNTYDGVVNAMDLEVTGIFQIGMSELDDCMVLVPLKIAQSLLDTKGVEQLIITLDSTDNVDTVLTQIRSNLPAGVLAKPWYTIAKIYRQVATFSRIQNRMIEIIILSLIILSILNTIGMSIFERTGEIGTMAALGETPKTILTQFLLEGFVLGVLGAIVGIVSAILAVKIINLMNIPIRMPGTSMAFILKITMYPLAFINGIFLSIISATVAAFIPAMRASKMNIAEALRRSI